jgi:hypothetical protein
MTLFRLFDCLDKVIFAIQCNNEYDKLYGKKSKKIVIKRLTEKIDDAMGNIVFFGILSYGVFKGWVKMPEPYLGDGFDFDNFGSGGC